MMPVRSTEIMLVIFIFLALTHQGQSANNITMNLQNQVSLPNSNASFRCIIAMDTSSSVNSTPPDITWSFTPVNSSTSYVILNPNEKDAPGLVDSNTAAMNQSGGDTDTKNAIKYHREVLTDLTISSVGPEDAGSYTCALKESGQSAVADLYIIDGLPECTKNNSGPVYYEGDNVTMGCSLGFHGNHAPKLDWEIPTIHVDYQHLTTVHNSTLTKISTSLHLRLLHMIDGKLFKCHAKFNGIDNPFSCEEEFQPLSVLYGVYISHMQTNPRTEDHHRQVQAGAHITMYCMAHGNPSPQGYNWKHITNKGNTETPVACTKRNCRLENLTLADAGTYTCTVNNTIKGVLHTANVSISLIIVPQARSRVVIGSTSGPLVTEYTEAGISPYAIGAIVCASLAVILIIVFILLAMKMRSRENRMHERLTRMHDENLDDQEVELLDENIQPDTTELPAEYGRLKQQWEIVRKDIRLVDLIAKGSYVEVWRGRMRKYPRRNDIMKVAIKRIIPEATEKERKFFLADLEVMKAIQAHPNILPLIGCYTASDPWLMMVEYAVEGSLYQYLQHRRPGDLKVEINMEGNDSVMLKSMNLTAHKLLTLAATVIHGLQHLNRFKMIFYRLRAANVLVCKGGVCKLSGFGFVQDITERNLYETNSAPVRWMSPESLVDNIFNVKTDIWSFGILLWEIVHFGHLPYPDMGPHEVSEKIHTGYRMPQPLHCSGDIYNLMLMCWAQSADNRPSLGDIMQNLAHLADNADTHINIDKLPEGLKSSDIVDNSSAMA